ncbi:MAG: class I SAM-dependent methyltransferase [Gallionella sp.]|nr:class I SAM-dependent methyltransferase [Gallionella sp.]
MNREIEDSLYARLAGLGRDELLKFIERHFPGLVGQNIEADWPLTGKAFDSLSAQEVAAVERAVGDKLGGETLKELASWKTRSIQHYRREILRYGCTVLPDLLRERTRMCAANPPAEVHSMQRQELFAGDLYSGDMCVSALSRAGKAIVKDGHYLDFGCSSGALVRNMWAGFPYAHWHGSDPVPSSIEWARAQFPQIDFIVNSQEPPLPYAENSMDGVYAISIWSHFSERAALAWFEEMHRILKPGGFLMLTNHGVRSLYYYLEQKLMSPDIIARMLSEIICRQFVLQDVWENQSAAADGLKTVDWGNSYFVSEWVALRLHRNWRVLDYKPGLNQSNQDVYVLECM